jgi:CubicO group peptidase (beta-lactamase class C family)
MDEIVLEPDASGVQVGSSYAYLTPRDWARMGQLWLDAWHGRSEVISQAWQRLAVTPGTAKGGEIYGLGFWLNTDHRAFPSSPENTFHAGGNSGQFVVVIPDKELVVVRLGLTLNESRADMNALLADVLAAL